METNYMLKGHPIYKSFIYINLTLIPEWSKFISKASGKLIIPYPFPGCMVLSNSN